MAESRELAVDSPARPSGDLEAFHQALKDASVATALLQGRGDAISVIVLFDGELVLTPLVLVAIGVGVLQEAKSFALLGR